MQTNGVKPENIFSSLGYFFFYRCNLDKMYYIENVENQVAKRDENLMNIEPLFFTKNSSVGKRLQNCKLKQTMSLTAFFGSSLRFNFLKRSILIWIGFYTCMINTGGIPLEVPFSLKSCQKIWM